jgi:hypothetical protein
VGVLHRPGVERVPAVGAVLAALAALAALSGTRPVGQVRESHIQGR